MFSLNFSKKSAAHILNIGFILLGLSACESKMNEKKVTEYEKKQDVQFKVKLNDELDQKLQELQASLSLVQDLLSKAQDGFGLKKMATTSLVELVTKVNQEVVNKTIDLKNQKLIVNGSVEIKSELLSEDCQVFDFQLKSENISPLEELVYSMGSCYTEGQLLSLFKVEFKDQQTKVIFDQKNSSLVLPLKNLEDKIANCDFNKNSQSGFQCSNIVFSENENELWFANINSKFSTEIKIFGYSKKSNQLKWKGILVLSKDLKVEKANLEGPLVAE